MNMCVEVVRELAAAGGAAGGAARAEVLRELAAAGGAGTYSRRVTTSAFEGWLLQMLLPSFLLLLPSCSCFSTALSPSEVPHKSTNTEPFRHFPCETSDVLCPLACRPPHFLTFPRRVLQAEVLSSPWLL